MTTARQWQCPAGVSPAMFTALTALVIARAAEFGDAELVVYLSALSDLQPTLVARACAELAKRPRMTYETAMFDVGTIRRTVLDLATADRIAAEQRMLSPGPSSDDDPRSWVFCLECGDQGWAIGRCEGVGVPRPAPGVDIRDGDKPIVPCLRTHTHTGHSHAAPCRCIHENPIIARRRAFTRRTA